MRTDNVIRNMIFALLQAIVGMFFPFVVRACTIKYLGSEYMGLNNLCTSVLHVLSVTDLGLENAFAFQLYKPVAQRDKEEVCRLLNCYKKIYFVIGMTVLGIGVMILPFFQHFISSDVPEGVNVYLIFFVYLLNTVISYIFFAYKSLLFIADQRKDYESIILTVYFCVLYTIQILLLRAHQYYLSVFVMPVCTLIAKIVRNQIAIRKYPDYNPHGVVTESQKAALKTDAFSIAVYKFRDISRDTFDSIALSTMKGLVVLSNYQNYYMVMNVPLLLLNMFYANILPSIGNFAISNDSKEIFDVYKKMAFIMTRMAGWFAICYCFLIQDFIVIWLGTEYQMSWRIVVLFSTYIYLYGETKIAQIMREGIGMWQQGRIWAAVEMVVNLGLNVLLLVWIGTEGVILATVISVLLISIPAENRIIFSRCFVGKGRDKLKSMGINVLWLMGTAGIVGLLCRIAPHVQYVSFIYKMCVCALIPPLTCTICFYRTEEFRFFQNIMRRVIRK